MADTHSWGKYAFTQTGSRACKEDCWYTDLVGQLDFTLAGSKVYREWAPSQWT